MKNEIGKAKMKFTFKNFGFIDNATIELADLTIICGPNNVGKTYLSYGIYGFIRRIKSLIDFTIDHDKILELKEKGSIEIDLASFKKDIINKKITSASINYSKTLSEYFNAPEDFFIDSKFSFSLKNFDVNLSTVFRKDIIFGTNKTFIFDKEQNSSILSIVFKTNGKIKIPLRIINDMISDVITECLLRNAFPKPFVVTSERIGIALFYKELDLSKNKIIEHLTENDRTDPIAILNSMRSRYAKPIQENIDIIRDYEEISKRKSFIRKKKDIHKPILDILQELLGGNFKANDKQLFYYPKKERNRNKVVVPFYIASSSVKSLFLIDLYINCFAENKGILIIDEPELNLHPDNQRKMASLLARLVNTGIKVMITTHSDYLIREINNRIMLSSNVSGKAAIMKKNKILNNDILLPSQVQAYYCKKDHSIEKVNVDKLGVDISNFDELILDTNELSESIYHNMMEE